MLTIESTVAAVVRFTGGGHAPTYSRRLSHCFNISLFTPWHKCRRLSDGTSNKREILSTFVGRASAEEPQDAAWNPIKQNAKSSQYHPLEDIIEPQSMEGENAMLTPAESCRTIIEVNNEATLIHSNLVNDEVHENAIWPDLPYVTDEYGNIYFQVKKDQDILQTLSVDEDLVQVVIGLDTAEVLSEMESLASLGFDNDEDSDYDDEVDDVGDDDDDSVSDTEWVSVLEEEEEEEEEEEDLEYSNGSLGDWAKLETMHSSHPMYFAKKIVDVVSDDPVDYMDLPPAGLAIQGLLRPALPEDYSIIQKHKSESNPIRNDASLNQIGSELADKVGDLGTIDGKFLGQKTSQPNMRSGDSDNDESLNHSTLFYKLEMIKIQLISVDQTIVKVEDFRKATPDAIAHSAANIISRLKSGGEKTTQALKSLCWRCKGIQVEEASVIGMDTLGFDMRICSGKQLQTLRFTFNTRASSEYGAERQLNDLLFPRNHHNLENKKTTQQTES